MIIIIIIIIIIIKISIIIIIVSATGTIRGTKVETGESGRSEDTSVTTLQGELLFH